MTDNRKPEEIAVSRHKIISPVLVAIETGEDAAKITELKKEVCAANGISRLHGRAANAKRLRPAKTDTQALAQRVQGQRL
jgi:hypothetical protein